MTLSDITSETKSNQDLSVDLVGMENVEIPVKYKETFLPALHNIFVNLDDKDAKGIHMSRIFLITKKYFENNHISFRVLSKITQEFLESQNKKSSAAKIQSTFTYIKKYPSLLSNNNGWRYYPVTFTCERNKTKTIFELSTKIVYSSTCPCSAGLSRQKIQEKFLGKFTGNQVSKTAVFDWLAKEEAHPATPHSQRSIAFITLKFSSLNDIPEINSVIEIAEKAVQTPVQSVVKREDEQAFAEANAANLLFCEDAVRRITSEFQKENLRNFSVKVEHQESLHPHNAIASITQQNFS